MIAIKHPWKIITTLMATAAMGALGCMSTMEDPFDEGAYGLFALQTSAGQRVAEITDFKSAEAYAKKMGYYDEALCNTYLRGGEQVWYSGSYGTEGEAGRLMVPSSKRTSVAATPFGLSSGG